jgi:hypothetical protein
MSKAALLMLQFNRPAEDFWKTLVTAITPNTLSESQSAIFASIEVKSYSLADHQFIQAKVSLNGKERIILIPRNFVVLIIELPSIPDGDPFHFFGKTSK